MYPLIEIKTVPIEIEVKTSRAQLEYARGTAEMEISHDSSGVNIKSRPIRLNVDRFESRNQPMPRSSGSPVAQPSQFSALLNQTSATANQPAAYQATATYADQQGQILVNARIDQETTGTAQSIAAQAQQASAASVASGEMQIRYEMDKLNFNWRTGNVEFTFVPGDIEISITQRPDLIIKYIGGPLYVPPSADPDYEPLDMLV